MNAKLLLAVTDDAEHVYRERFLRERYGLPVHDAPPATPDAEDADVIDVVEMFDHELSKSHHLLSSRASSEDDPGDGDAPGGRVSEINYGALTC